MSTNDGRADRASPKAGANDLLEHAEAHATSMFDRLRELVEIESPTMDKGCVDRLGARLVEMAAEVGAEVQSFPQVDFGDHLRFDFGGPTARRIVLVGHMDTVWPRGTLERAPFRIDADKAFGPGVFDMKAGLVQMLGAISALRERMPCRVQALVTSDEEVGSPSSRALVEETCAGAAAVLVLEPPLSPGGLVKTSRKGVGLFRLLVHGKEAHAGLEPENGVHAIYELAVQMQRLRELNDPARGVSVSVGRIRGGSRTNVIPAEALAEIDVRALTQADAHDVEAKMRSFEPSLAGARLSWEGGMNRPPMERTPAVVRLYELARAVAEGYGFSLGEGGAGGGSDGNFTAAMGIPTLDGLGVNGAGAHAPHEHVLISDIPRRTALLAGLIERIASEPAAPA